MELDKIQNAAFEKWKNHFKKVTKNSGISFRISEDEEKVIFFREKDNEDLFAKPIRSLISNLTRKPVRD